MVHELSYSAACGILVPQPGIEPAPSELQGGFLTTELPGKSLNVPIWWQANPIVLMLFINNEK